MPRGISGWSTDDLISFLRAHGFVFNNQKEGSHEAWIHRKDQRIIEINRTHATYPERTMETMIRQSGIPKKEWKAWTRLSKQEKKKKVKAMKDNQ